eukprot:TRINITY_DN10839_c0_g1_i1.p1 TRINITY_DN10839_c0_g1~~TRINITY_DN10839_c0_g1_i1.p1  ORF type:complete len:124 (+),score=57.87 TRINITY_DN10839_c0_g1_i1:27-398(+)
MIRRPPRSTQSRSSAASDVYKRQLVYCKSRHCISVADQHQQALSCGSIEQPDGPVVRACDENRWWHARVIQIEQVLVSSELSGRHKGGHFCQEVLEHQHTHACLLYTSPSPRDRTRSRMPSSA